MKFSSSNYNVLEQKLHIIIDTGIQELSTGVILQILSESIKELIHNNGYRQRIEDELVKQLLSLETKSALSKMISEIVSETIKETIMEMKRGGLL